MDIRLSGFGDDGKRSYNSGHDWASTGATLVQGGSRGVVFSPTGNYRTAFVEVFGDKLAFVRGEGKTLDEAAEAAWTKVQSILNCPGHDYEPRGYTNGIGFCKHCRHQGRVGTFTPEDLGQFCSECGTPTYSKIMRTRGDQPVIFRCDDHMPGNEFIKEHNSIDENDDSDDTLDRLFDLLNKSSDAQKEFWDTYSPESPDENVKNKED